MDLTKLPIVFEFLGEGSNALELLKVGFELQAVLPHFRELERRLYQRARGVGRRRQRLRHFQCGLVARPGFDRSVTRHRGIAGAKGVGDGRFRMARLLEMVSQEFGLRFGGMRESFLQQLADLVVQALAFGFQQAVVGRVLHEGVLEPIGHVGMSAAALDQLGG